jgi:hypothetical protein
MKVRRGTVGFVAGVLLATTLTATTMALAESRSSSTLHACAARKGGALRLAAHCATSERAVSWNATGPRGPRGPRGLAGTDGTDGAGPAYLSRQSSSTLVGSGPQTAVDTMTLPPGDYLVTATATASSPNAGGDNGSCQISGAGLFSDSASFSLIPTHGEALAVTGLAHATSVDGTVKLLCGGATSVTIAEGLLTAVQVTSVTDLSTP